MVILESINISIQQNESVHYSGFIRRIGFMTNKTDLIVSILVVKGFSKYFATRTSALLNIDRMQQAAFRLEFQKLTG